MILILLILLVVILIIIWGVKLNSTESIVGRAVDNIYRVGQLMQLGKYGAVETAISIMQPTFRRLDEKNISPEEFTLIAYRIRPKQKVDVVLALVKYFNENDPFIIKQEPQKDDTNMTTSDNEKEVDVDDLNKIDTFLRSMGYKLTPYGAGVALLSLESGYREAEVASHFTCVAIASFVKQNWNDIEKIAQLIPHVTRVLEKLKDFKDMELMSEKIWKNDSTAIFKVSQPSSEQQEWVDIILNDPMVTQDNIVIKL